jgi:hypothetical protein
MKVCGKCLMEHNIRNRRVATAMLAHPVYNTPSLMLVCAACAERGQTTRVTCRTFVDDEEAAFVSAQ